MSKASGLSGRIVGKYLAGQSDPSRERLIALAKAANVSVLWLATGEGPMYPQPPGKDESEASFKVNEQPGAYRVPRGAVSPIIVVDKRAAIKAVNEVMDSDHEGVKLALMQNALMFQEMVRNAREIDEIKRDMDAIKRRLLEPREDDFKLGVKREKDRAGGNSE